MTRTSHSAITLAGLALLTVWVPTAAHAQDAGPVAKPAPDLSVAFDGPDTAVAGSTEVWTLTVRNDGTAAAAGFTVSTAVPTGVRVALRGAPDDWSTCVLGVSQNAGEVSAPSDLTCSYDGELAAGAQAAELPVELSFEASLLGPQSIGAVVSPAAGEAEGALANNRSSRTTTLSAPPTATTTPVTAPAAPPATAPAEAAAPAAAAPAAAAAAAAPVTGRAQAAPAGAATPAGLPFTGVSTTEGAALGVLLVLAGMGLLLAGRARPAPRTA